MARKLKHSKIKNTGILFELLTRQITADVLAGKSTKTVSIVKTYFNETTELVVIGHFLLQGDFSHGST